LNLFLSRSLYGFKQNIFSSTLANMMYRALCLLVVALTIAIPSALKAQTAGDGTISGTVTDDTGAVVPNAKVTATNVATNIATVPTSSGAGLYTIAPLPPGTYTLTIEANGFRALRQQNLTVNALSVLTLNTILTVGETNETVEVTAAPPVLDTSTATLGLVMENDTYSNLPIQMNNAQRDATAFGAMAPGAQGAPVAARLPIIGGTGNYSRTALS
jgi:hypothetical protein